MENALSEAYHATPVPVADLSSLYQYNIDEKPQLINITIGAKRGKIVATKMKIKLFAASMHNDTNFHKLLPLDIAFTPNADSTIWKGSFWPGKLKLSPGDPYKVMIYFADHTREQRYTFEREFTPENIFTRYRQWFVFAGIIAGYLFVIVCIWYFFPLLLLTIYQKLRPDEWAKLAGPPFNALLSLIQLFFPLSFFVNTPHVYNAWMKKYKDVINGHFNQLHAVKERNTYIPLPFSYQSSAETPPIFINDFEEIAISQASQKRELIQIIGEGGIGKTTLAIQLSRWLINSGSHKKYYRAVCMLDIPTVDLLATISEKFALWFPHQTIPSQFTRGLFKNGNLVVFVDALSESSESMQEYIDNIHGKLPVNTIIVTSRTPYSFQQLPCQFFYPQFLDAQALLFFVTSYVDSIRNTESTAAISNILSTEKQKLDFTAKILSIIQDNIEHHVSASQVKIIIDYFFSALEPSSSFEALLEKMPENILDIYYYYIQSTNPVNTKATNYQSYEHLVKVVELLGSLSVEGNYIPKDIEKGMARKRIAAELPYIVGDPIQRLIDNNIIFEKQKMGTYFLRFNIDSMAEVTAAKYYYLQHIQSGDLHSFTQTILNMNHANGFKTAFLRVRKKMS